MAPSQGHTSSSSCLVPLYSSILGCIHSTVIRKCNTCIYVSSYTYSDTHHMIPTSHITCITHSIRTITQFHPGRIQRQEEDRERDGSKTVEFDSVFRHHTERYRQTQRDTDTHRQGEGVIHPPFNFRARDVLFGLVRAMSFLRKGCSGGC